MTSEDYDLINTELYTNSIAAVLVQDITKYEVL